jgi:hypothetical protein
VSILEICGARSLKTRYLLLNWTRVRVFQIQVFLGSAVLFTVYGAFLVLYCETLQGFSLALLLLSTQFGVGLVSTRYYQTIGIKTRRRLTFLDSSELTGDWGHLEEELEVDGISRLFEDLQVELQGEQPRSDDVLDLTWFVVIVWSAISTAAAVLMGSLPFLCASPALVLASLCAVCCYDGYRNGTIDSFSEDLDHLEHLAFSRISAVQVASSGTFFMPFARWRSKNRTRILTDIGVHLLGRSLEESDSVITYSVGFSPAEFERLEILHSASNDPSVLDPLSRLELVKDLAWSVSKESTLTGHKTVLANAEGSPNIRNPVTLVRSPSELERVTLAIVKAIELTLELVSSGQS